MPHPGLTPTSYIVLGLLRFAGEATPYELKATHAGSVGFFWAVPHSQLYAEPDRLVARGLATVRQEERGRRRKHYRITDEGVAALDAWLAGADLPRGELREPALLKVFFGADPTDVAVRQVEAHRERLATLTAIRDRVRGLPNATGPLHTLDAGIAMQEAWIAFWERLAAGSGPVEG